jgi:outer membrane protein OmpA-like peptidoglycan-associated protein
VVKLLVTLMLLAGVAHGERRVVTDTSIEILGPIHFEGATARLHPGRSTQHMLDAVANTFVGNPSILKVEVRAYGTDATAQRGLLGMQRARAIVVALAERGVDARRLVPRGFAGPRPGESSDPAFYILKRATDHDAKPGLLQKP